jgi:hypothetical protein
MSSILFICGCLESGKDGVGDYSLELANSFADENFRVYVVAVNDVYVVEKSEYNSVKGSSVEILRLSQSLSWKQRGVIFQSFLNKVNPALISLQYVPYSFGKYGLPYAFTRIMKKYVRGRCKNIHIMFHELWIADARAHTWKEFVFRFLQKKLIVQLVQNLKPTILSTSNEHYKSMLGKIRLSKQIHVFPIFSNISRIQIEDIGAIRNKNTVNICLFGNLQFSNTLKNRLIQLNSLIYKVFQKRSKFIHIGSDRSGVVKDMLNDQRSNDSDVLDFVKLGFLEAEEISKIMQSCQFGVSNYLPIIYKKSGSIASMLHNGLPVVLVNDANNEELMIDATEVSLFEDLNTNNIESFIYQSKEFMEKYHAIKTMRRLKEMIS